MLKKSKRTQTFIRYGKNHTVPINTFHPKARHRPTSTWTRRIRSRFPVTNDCVLLDTHVRVLGYLCSCVDFKRQTNSAPSRAPKRKSSDNYNRNTPAESHTIPRPALKCPQPPTVSRPHRR